MRISTEETRSKFSLQLELSALRKKIEEMKQLKQGFAEDELVIRLQALQDEIIEADREKRRQKSVLDSIQQDITRHEYLLSEKQEELQRYADSMSSMKGMTRNVNDMRNVLYLAIRTINKDIGWDKYSPAEFIIEASKKDSVPASR